MPNRVYHPPHPVTWWARLLVHPMETAVATIASIFGTLIALSLVVTAFSPSQSLATMPPIIIVCIGGTLGTGGILAIAGINWWGDDLSRGWGIEFLGWVLTAAGLLTYAISVAWQHQGSVFSWALPALLGAGSILRAISLVLMDRDEKRSKQLREEGADQ